eukprot:938929-Alexandrium_andersonii.AAC.1
MQLDPAKLSHPSPARTQSNRSHAPRLSPLQPNLAPLGLRGWPADSVELYATWLGLCQALLNGLAGLRWSLSGLGKRPKRAKYFYR